MLKRLKRAASHKSNECLEARFSNLAKQAGKEASTPSTQQKSLGRFLWCADHCAWDSLNAEIHLCDHCLVVILVWTTVTSLGASVNKAARKLAHTACIQHVPLWTLPCSLSPWIWQNHSRDLAEQLRPNLEGMLLVKAGLFHAEDNVCTECQCAFCFGQDNA